MDVVIDKNVYLQLDNFVKNYNKVALICDSSIYPLFKNYFHDINPLIIPLKASEEIKSFNTLPTIYQKLIDQAFDKKSLIIAFGGGVILDIAGFVASTYLRGIDFISLPTTLLSMCDACLGGKTAVNFNGLKNYIGSFYEPKSIFIELNTLKTLSHKEFISGLAEVIKHAIIDDSLLKFLENKCELILKRDEETLKHMIWMSLDIKKKIISKDFKDEAGTRALLNFGHTVGHALESITQFQSYSHGQAISIGMIAEAFVSYKLDYLKKEDFEKLKKLLKMFELPVTLSCLRIQELIDLMKKDKKSVNNTLSFVAMYNFGKIKLINGIDPNVFSEILRELTLINE